MDDDTDNSEEEENEEHKFDFKEEKSQQQMEDLISERISSDLNTYNEITQRKTEIETLFKEMQTDVHHTNPDFDHLDVVVFLHVFLRNIQ